MTRAIPAVLAALVLAACSSPEAGGPPAASGEATPPPAATGAADLSALPAHCTARGGGAETLPDPACTPGATDPRVTQANIATTICRTGYTRTVRPPTTYTEPLKRELARRYGDTGPLRDYELDHLVSLELGGSPTAAVNLWPEPGASPNPKDQVEQVANHAICAGRLPLADAQRRISANWIEFGRSLGLAV